MREKIVIQPEFNYNPSHLKVTNDFYAKYEGISNILDKNPDIVDIVHRDIGGIVKSLNNSSKKNGRPFGCTTETVVRILCAQIIEGLSLRQIVVRIDDSNYLRHFVRIYSKPMIDFTTLDKLKNAIRPKTWEAVNAMLSKYAVNEHMIFGKSLRLDTTAVETNIHWPTDSSLLWDVYRVLARLIENVRKFDTGVVEKKRLQLKKVKKLASKIARCSSHKKHTAKKRIKKLYKKLIKSVESIVAWCSSIKIAIQEALDNNRYDVITCAMAKALVEEIKYYTNLGSRVVEQTVRRVLKGEKVPSDEKLFSIFEPHTELLMRGKQNKNIEFGHMVEIEQVISKFITRYEVFEKRPNENTLVEPALKYHKKLFGSYPDRITADKGYYENMETIAELEDKVPVVAIAKKGKRTKDQIEREESHEFKIAQKFRAGVEGTISFLKRTLGLLRCFNKSWEHFEATVGMTVFAHNVLILSRM